MCTAAAIAMPMATSPAVAAQASAPAAAAQPSGVVSRIAVVVRDIDRSKQFYTQGLGYHATFDGDISRDSVREMLGLRADQHMRFVVLAIDQTLGGVHREGANIGLIEVTKGRLPAARRPRGVGIVLGESMLAMQTSDIQQINSRLRKLGADIVFGPKRAQDGSETELVVRDPDGLRIHIVERIAARP